VEIDPFPKLREKADQLRSEKEMLGDPFSKADQPLFFRTGWKKADQFPLARG